MAVESDEARITAHKKRPTVAQLICQPQAVICLIPSVNALRERAPSTDETLECQQQAAGGFEIPNHIVEEPCGGSAIDQAVVVRQ